MATQGLGLGEGEQTHSRGQAVGWVFGTDACRAAFSSKAGNQVGSRASRGASWNLSWGFLSIKVCSAKTLHSFKEVGGMCIFKNGLRKHVSFTHGTGQQQGTKPRRSQRTVCSFVLLHAKEKFYHFQLFKDLLQTMKKDCYTFWSA